MSKRKRDEHTDRPAGLADQLRQEVEKTGWTYHQLEVGHKLPRGMLSRFMSKKRGISLTFADRLAEVLGLCFGPDPAGPRLGTKPPDKRKTRWKKESAAKKKPVPKRARKRSQ